MVLLLTSPRKNSLRTSCMPRIILDVILDVATSVQPTVQQPALDPAVKDVGILVQAVVVPTVPLLVEADARVVVVETATILVQQPVLVLVLVPAVVAVALDVLELVLAHVLAHATLDAAEPVPPTVITAVLILETDIEDRGVAARDATVLVMADANTVPVDVAADAAADAAALAWEVVQAHAQTHVPMLARVGVVELVPQDAQDIALMLVLADVLVPAPPLVATPVQTDVRLFAQKDVDPTAV